MIDRVHEGSDWTGMESADTESARHGADAGSV